MAGSKVIRINNKKFTVLSTEEVGPSECRRTLLVGTLAGDPSFLAGKRTVVENDLIEKSKNNYSYDFDAR